MGRKGVMPDRLLADEQTNAFISMFGLPRGFDPATCPWERGDSIRDEQFVWNGLGYTQDMHQAVETNKHITATDVDPNEIDLE